MSDLADRVQIALEEMVRSGAETGLQVCVIQHGTVVVEATAGTADIETNAAVRPDTLFWIGSAAKAVMASVVHVLSERGVVHYDKPIAEVWPEFATHGKSAVTVRHALLHTAGVPGLPSGTTATDLTDWDRMCTALADQSPWWPPGSALGYHAHTYGFLLGETVRRITGRTASAALRDAISDPLDMTDELYFGVPQEALPRVARQVLLADDEPSPPPPPGSPIGRAMPFVPDPDTVNRVDVLTADIPSQGVASARALARMYAGLLGHVRGVDLVSDGRRRDLAEVHYRGRDVVMDMPTELGFGYSLARPALGARPGSTFGMLGMNGCVGYADIDSGVAVAVLRNRFAGGFAAAQTIDRLVAAATSPEREDRS
ncbi:serine hydrolase domain-containing protein [Luteipulveratus mongoliensis]|uniref:Beta-lactamase-related domain-containing protein n=1 Tax=Luteipulveratus mongoliensis TaxID=571913 RepID=A0A0K1JQL3_9MICO|nr:serine hydrolase domain-containing protein [Luteipulveratus mongoliensis]AKU18878.1 hypothetical protein VV02_12505 [Luteipulveratus mongoliensis]